MKSESFLKGTVILITANAISKILGAVLKIPLTYILGEEGMAIYHTSFSVYIMLLCLMTSGLPFSISKYISEQRALENEGNIRFTIRICVLLMSVLGILSSLLMYFGAGFFAYAMKDPKSTLAIRAIAPSILFVALGCVYKSCYQGYGNMTPTAISQVLESLIKLIFGYYLAVWFSSFSLKYSSAAAIFAVTIGEAFATGILYLLYIPYRRELRGKKPESRRSKILSSLLQIAIPMTATSVICGSLSLLETSVIRNSLTTIVFTEKSAKSFLMKYSSYTTLFDELTKTKRLSYDGARWLFGAYSGYAMTVFNLPVGILASFSVSILPIITSCITLKNYDLLKDRVSRAIKIVIVISLPCAVYLCIFSGRILNLLFKNTASAGILSALSPLIVITTLLSLINSVQYASGRIMTPFLYSLLGYFISIGMSYMLINIPELNIMGVIISSILADSLQLCLNYRSAHKSLGISFVSVGTALKVLLSGVIMGAFGILVCNPFCQILKNDTLGFLACSFLSGIIYLMCVFTFGAIKKEDILQLSKNPH